ncbi:MAG: zinc-ribbon domain-containing protein [Promethearchaeota archaeon]|nr:MAG: zinc-ribbon domain-containing protein [Candidatus Lokiarchaeota archaeon]
MNCHNCGTQINDLNVKFCESCGIELSLNKEPIQTDDKNIVKTPSRRKRCC